MSGNGFIRRGPMAADVFEQQFTQIHNAVFRDPRMSFKAKGIFGLITTHRDGYGLSIESICACSTDGVAAVRTGLNELEAHGYLYRAQERLDGPTKEQPNAKRGSWGRTEYYITDMPDGLVVSIPAPASGDEPQSPSSQPSCGNRTTDESEQSRRSAPSCDFPQAEEPRTENRAHKKITPQKTTSLSSGRPARGGQMSGRETGAAQHTAPKAAPARDSSVPAPRTSMSGQPDVDQVLNAYIDALSPVRPMRSVLNRLRREAAELLALDWPVEHVAQLAGQLPGMGYASLARHAEFHPPAVSRTARKTSPTACERHPAFEVQDCLRCAADERERLRREQSVPAAVDGAGLLARLRSGQSAR
ncbi:helix-turn-helix domain-containing protein [Streptomyces sp. DH12]|uniref:helix-turn-helix domain-containing protein n=1 Tax=Streptomyces sp. DH12 TaxID=2857010 RepID=UPI001E2D98EB|nr:helix-turn-helix domain-containing protein [Streptomyces sp. DH12]